MDKTRLKSKNAIVGASRQYPHPIYVIFYMDGCDHCEEIKEKKHMLDEFPNVILLNYNNVGVAGFDDLEGTPTMYTIYNGSVIDKTNDCSKLLHGASRSYNGY